MGRRRINIERLESSTQREVTFSKRRRGLFQKASDLCMLFDSHIAIITFSPHGNPFVFGHSSVDSVIGHYLTGTVPAGDGITLEHARILREIKEREALLKEKKRKDDRKRKEKIGVDCDELFKIEEINSQSLEELQSLYDDLMELREKVTKRIGMMSTANSTSGICGDGVNDVYVEYPLTLPPASSSTVYVHNSLLHSHGSRNFSEVYLTLASEDHGKHEAVVDGVNDVYVEYPLTLPPASSSTVYVHNSLLHSHGSRNFSEVYLTLASEDHGKHEAVVDGVNDVYVEYPLTLPPASSSTVYVDNSLLHSHGSWNFNEVYLTLASEDHGKHEAVVDGVNDVYAEYPLTLPPASSSTVYVDNSLLPSHGSRNFKEVYLTLASEDHGKHEAVVDGAMKATPMVEEFASEKREEDSGDCSDSFDWLPLLF